MPSLFVFVSYLTFVASFTATTLAFGTTAPEVSVTWPFSVAFVVWAITVVVTSCEVEEIEKTNRTNRIRARTHPPSRKEICGLATVARHAAKEHQRFLKRQN